MEFIRRVYIAIIVIKFNNIWQFKRPFPVSNTENIRASKDWLTPADIQLARIIIISWNPSVESIIL